MRIALPIMITIALASPALSQSGSGTINRRHVVGCRDSDVYDRIISMISAGNREAATALIARMLGTGECIIWDEAQRVRPEESGSLMVWEALGKARNWQDTGAWLVHWHRFIDHIASVRLEPSCHHLPTVHRPAQLEP